MKKGLHFIVKIRLLLYLLYAGLALIAFIVPAYASPFGQGVFGADTGFGSATSISMALSGNVALNLTSNGSRYTAKGSHTVTITSSDVVGYSLYAYALSSSDMINGSSTIPATTNTSPGILTNNTWGYNLDGSDNYLGLTTAPQVIKTASGPYKNGDTTNVTYGVATDFIKAAGSYSVSVVYTAACLSQ